MRITQERNVVTISIITACVVATALWFAGVTSHAERSPHKEATAPAGQVPIGLTAAETSTSLRTSGEYGKIPLGFELNQGQTDAEVQFLARGAGYIVFLTPTNAVLSLRRQGEENAAPKQATVLRMALLGANPASKVSGLDQLAGKSNYYIGNDPAKWRVDVPSYRRVSYQDIYKGIDLVYYGNQRQLENDFVVAPGVDPNVIAVAFEGAREIAIDKNGDLLLDTGDGPVRMQKPLVYQLIHGRRCEVAGSYVLRNRHTAGFS